MDSSTKDIKLVIEKFFLETKNKYIEGVIKEYISDLKTEKTAKKIKASIDKIQNFLASQDDFSQVKERLDQIKKKLTKNNIVTLHKEFISIITDVMHPELQKLELLLSNEKVKYAQETFTFGNYIQEACKQFTGMNFSTHPAKFIHPDISHPKASDATKKKNGYASAIIANCSKKNDGYLRFGNVNNLEIDTFGNAKKVTKLEDLKLYNFFNLKHNNKFIYDILMEKPEVRAKLFSSAEGDFCKLYEAFESATKTEKNITDQRLKQVYVQVNKDYHLLSIVNPSGILLKLRQSINDMHYCKEAEEAKSCKKEGKYHETGYKQIYDLTTINFGGTEKNKHQNISFLNGELNQAYLLNSLPPKLSNYDIRIPTTNFFNQTIKTWYFKEQFFRLQKLYKHPRPNSTTRRQIYDCYADIFDSILKYASQVREVLANNNYKAKINIPVAQQIWLFETQKNIKDNNWLDTIIKAIARFIALGCEAKDERLAEITKVITQYKEQLY